MAGCGLLHDVGKMSIPHEILNKSGKLSPDEWKIMQSHVDHTVRCLRDSGGVHRVILAVAEQHHEKLDGTGYPKGLAGPALNEIARMSAIADIFGALTDRRIYKPALLAERALAIMSEEMKGQVDQHLLSTLGSVLLEIGRVEEEAADKER